MEITIFKDIKETAQPFFRNVEVILKRIQEGSSKDLVKKELDQKKIKKKETFLNNNFQPFVLVAPLIKEMIHPYNNIVD